MAEKYIRICGKLVAVTEEVYYTYYHMGRQRRTQAQSESESLSNSVRWGFQARFKQGKVYYNHSNLLDYREGADGEPEIDEEQAVIVRRIFARYLMGSSVHKIMGRRDQNRQRKRKVVRQRGAKPSSKRGCHNNTQPVSPCAARG